jgi:hypothetical protein
VVGVAVCTWCDREMLTAPTCTVGVLHQRGVPVDMVRYGGEFWRKWRPSKRCGDCNVVPGGFHHLGCDMAECPICGEQQLMCGCSYDEDGPDDEDRSDDEDGWP